MTIAHLMASPFFGGPEKQMLGLAQHLPARYPSLFVSFSERGLCRPFLEQTARHGFDSVELRHNYPHLVRATRELTDVLTNHGVRLLTCSGYKPDLVGWWAARRLRIPVVAIAHGWTGATWKVRLNEALDRRVMRCMDAVACVSHAQAAKVRAAGVPESRVEVIHNAVAEEAFAPPDPAYASQLRAMFVQPPRRIVGVGGRLSPEKGIDRLVAAAALLRQRDPQVGFVVFGDGPLRASLAAQIDALGLHETVVLAGFRADVGKFLPHLDVLAIPSYTEGLPVILLEAFAAGVPVVATAVGGIPEVVEPGHSGWLVPAGDAAALADRILDITADSERARAFGQHGRERVRRDFTFTLQAEQYQSLFDRLLERTRSHETPRELTRR